MFWSVSGTACFGLSKKDSKCLRVQVVEGDPGEQAGRQPWAPSALPRGRLRWHLGLMAWVKDGVMLV